MSIAAMPSAWLRRKLRQVGDGECGRRTMHLATDRLTDLHTELEQLAVDARRTPERVGKACLARISLRVSALESFSRHRESSELCVVRRLLYVYTEVVSDKLFL
jgi:hypothetical protein